MVRRRAEQSRRTFCTFSLELSSCRAGGSRIANSRADSRIGQRCVARGVRPTLTRAHEEPPVRPAPPRGHDREAVWSWWRASGDRRESCAQAATDRAAARPPARAQPDAGRPAALRIRIALPQSRAHSKARHRGTPLDAPGVSCRVGAPQVPLPVLLAPVPQEARPEGAERGTYPSYRRAQVAQSAIRLSTDRAHHLAYVRRQCRQEHRPPSSGGTGPSWLSFIGHTSDSLWSVDLFRCESIVLRTYWVLVVMDQFTRRLVGVGVHQGAVTGIDVCRMFNAAIHGQGAPRHLSTDHDPLFEAHRWTANLRILEI